MSETEVLATGIDMLPSSEPILDSIRQPVEKELNNAFDYYVLQRAEALVTLFTGLDPREKVQAGFNL